MKVGIFIYLFLVTDTYYEMDKIKFIADLFWEWGTSDMFKKRTYISHSHGTAGTIQRVASILHVFFIPTPSLSFKR